MILRARFCAHHEGRQRKVPTDGEDVDEKAPQAPNARFSNDFFRFLSREEAAEALSREDQRCLEREGITFRSQGGEDGMQSVMEEITKRVS